MIADYFKEMQQYELLEEPGVGFIMYRIFGEEFHIGHFYITPENRKNQNTMKFGMMGQQIAKEKGCKFISGIVTLGERDPATVSRLVKNYIQFGCNIVEMYSNPNDPKCGQIIFRKDI